MKYKMNSLYRLGFKIVLLSVLYDSAVLVLIKHTNTFMCGVFVHLPDSTTTFACNTYTGRQFPV